MCCATAAVCWAGVADPLGVLCPRGEQGTSPSRVSYRLAHTARCLKALTGGVPAALIITLHDNTITMAATSWAVPVLLPSGDTLALRVSASFLCERLDCHCRSAISLTQCNHLRFVSAAGSRRSRQPQLPIKQRRLQACRHLCDGCVQSSLLMRSILGNRGHVTTSDSSVHTCSAACTGWRSASRESLSYLA